ncbi:hypothetical protein CL620_03405 [archaeon]|nr:hypothetical protein [archaeon]
MGQNDIYQFLTKNKGIWFTSKQIQGKIGGSSSAISSSLKRLRKDKFVYFKAGRKGMFSYMVTDSTSSRNYP